MGGGRFVVKSGSVGTKFVSDFSVEGLVSQEISSMIYQSIGILNQSWHSPVIDAKNVFSIVLEDRVIVTTIVKDGKKKCEPSSFQDIEH